MRRFRVAYAALTFLLAACDDRADSTARMPAFCRDVERDYALRDSGGIQIVTNVRPVHDSADSLLLAAEPVLSIGVTEGDAAFEFGRVAAATRSSDGNIVVADGQNMELRVFDPTGSFLASHGQRGSGPGEFQAISGLFPAKDTFRVLDGRSRRMTTLDAAFRVVGTSAVPAIRWTVHNPATGRDVSGSSTVRIKGVLGDGSLIVGSSMRAALRTEEVTNVSRDSMMLQHASADFSRVDSLFVVRGAQLFEFYPGDGSVTFGDAPFGYVESLAVASDRFYHSDGTRFVIEERRPDGTLTRLIRICELPDSIPAATLDNFIETRLSEFSPEALVYEEPAWRGIPRPTVAPAHLQFIMDRADRLWVRDFTFPGEWHRWKVINRAGRWLADVLLPPDLGILEIGGDYVLGRTTNDLDVHVVEMYRLPAISSQR